MPAAPNPSANTSDKPSARPTAKPPVPERHHTATPHLIVKHSARALDFYARAFGAVELGRCLMPDGQIGHAEIRIGDSLITLAGEYPELGFLGPQARGGSTVILRLYVEDVPPAELERRIQALFAK